MAIEYRAAKATLDGDTLVGLVTPFNVETAIGDVSRNGFYEKVNPAAFTRTLQERDVVLIHSHDTSKPLARTSIKSGPGSLALTPDPSAGLRAHAIPVQTSVGRDVLELAKAGVIRGMSFGFEVTKDRWTDDQGRAADAHSGTHREILEVRLHEVTTTAFPAYPTTELSARDLVTAARDTRSPSAPSDADLLARSKELGLMSNTHSDPSDADLLAQYRELTSAITPEPHTPSLRSDIFAAELATAKTKGVRREAIKRFEAAQQRLPQGQRFKSWLASFEHGRWHESRAASEGTNTSGGYLVPPRFLDALIHQMREYDTLLNAFELWESGHGEPTNRPTYSQFTAAATDTENTAFTEGPYPTLAQQAWGLTPSYAASFRPSFQLVQDAFNYPTEQESGANYATLPFRSDFPNRSLDEWVAAALGESLGRAMAPVASAAMYSTISGAGAWSAGNSGGYLSLAAATAVTFSTGATTELAANTINLDTAAQMINALDPAYLPGAKFYFSNSQWTGLLRQVDSNKHTQIDPGTDTPRLYGFPVVATSQTSPAAVSTVSGPVFGDLQSAMTLRIADGLVSLLRSAERYADYGQMYYRSLVRADVQPRDARAVVGLKYAAS